MTKTTADLVTKAAGNLGFLAAGQTISAEDSAFLTALTLNLFEELSGESIIDTPDVDAIEDSVFLPMARILAERAAPDYGRATDENVVLFAKAQIRKVTYGRPTREPLAVDYF